MRAGYVPRNHSQRRGFVHPHRADPNGNLEVAHCLSSGFQPEGNGTCDDRQELMEGTIERDAVESS